MKRDRHDYIYDALRDLAHRDYFKKLFVNAVLLNFSSDSSRSSNKEIQDEEIGAMSHAYKLVALCTTKSKAGALLED